MHSDLRQITHPKMQNYQAKSSYQVFNDYSFVPSNRKEKQPVVSWVTTQTDVLMN